MKLEQQFTTLVNDLGQFFKEDTASAHDYQTINRLRDQAIALTDEALRTHRLSALTAFALSNQTIETEYALHPIQLLCLALYGTRGFAMEVDQRHELVTAALFCDLGFRMAWPFYSDHATTAVRALGEHRLPWWSVKMENLIAYHHAPDKDPSPYQILSLCARYLELLRGTGVEQSATDMLSPAKAIQAISEEARFQAATRHSFSRHLGKYPIGSWICLTTGRKGLILAIRPQAPQEPLLAIPKSERPEESTRFMLLDPKKNGVAVFSTAPPIPLRDVLFSDPGQWIPGWEKELSEMEAQPDFQLTQEVLMSPEPPPPQPVDKPSETRPPSTPPAPSVSAPPAEKIVPTPSRAAETFHAPGLLAEFRRGLERMSHGLRHNTQEAIERADALTHQLAGLEEDLVKLPTDNRMPEDTQAIQVIRVQALKQKQILAGLTEAFQKRWGTFSKSWTVKTESALQRWEQDRQDDLHADADALCATWQEDIEAFLRRVEPALQKTQLYRQHLAGLSDVLSEKCAYGLFLQGIEHRKLGRPAEAAAALEKAAGEKPFLWEASIYLQVCALRDRVAEAPTTF